MDTEEKEEEEELTPCPDCGTKPGQRHIGGCDVARCINSGYQYISCPYIEVDENGEYLPEAECCHHCGPDVWTGEWPGVAECREYGWYTTIKGIRGNDIVTEDLNKLQQLCRWNSGTQRWEKR